MEFKGVRLRTNELVNNNNVDLQKEITNKYSKF